MTDRPIIFSAPMVRALLDGRKTQTRRTLRVQPPNRPGWKVSDLDEDGVMWRSGDGAYCACRLPYAPGDRLWVREAFVRYHDLDDNDMRIGPLKVAYKADGGFRWLDADTDTFRDSPPWKPSIHMPRWSSRLTLIVTDVRVQRLQDISRDDAIAEGLTLASNAIEEFWRWPPPHDARLYLSPIIAFRDLWNSLHGPDAWDANPWCVAVSFTVQKGNIDGMEAST
jgi:hypothetical protein